MANNQPVAMKYLYHAKKAGTKVVCVNAYREPGMARYWVPSNVESAIFGTKVTDRFFDINVGGDIGFLNGVLKHMVERGWVDRSFVDNHTTGFDAMAAALRGQTWAELEAVAGTSRDEMLALAEMLHRAKTAVLVWSMGVTQHEFGEDNVRAIINLGLSKGFVGRDKCGLMPIRGHSGVQGGAEMGAYATVLPGGVPIDEAGAARLQPAVGVPGAVVDRADRARDDRRRARRRAGRADQLGRQLPGGAAGSRVLPGSRWPGSRCASTSTSASPRRCSSTRPRPSCCCPRRPGTRWRAA